MRSITGTVTILLLFLSGCGSLPASIDANDKLDPTKGMIVASVTVDTGKHTNDSWFYFRKKGTEEGKRLAAVGHTLIIKPNDYPDHPSRSGRLVAIPVEPGEYELYGWVLYIQTFGGYGYIAPKTPPPAYTFTVTPGKITYLGALHVTTLMGKNIFGLQIPAGGEPEILDNYDADTALMKRKYPALSSWLVEKYVPAKDLWKSSPQ